MRSNIKNIIIIMALGIIFTLSTVSNFNLIDDQGNNEGTIEIRGEGNLKGLKRSGSYIESFIHIDGNWSDTASTYDWCSGDGSWSNPYTIENVTIDASGSPTGSGILINNSKNEYFIINNCTVYNAGSGAYYAGIRFENTNNGTLRNNNCSNNGYAGILLNNNCKNNTISKNVANDNDSRGILLLNNCKNNIILENTANNNLVDGISLYKCDNNTISNNTAKSNIFVGIIIVDSSYNTITRNIANNNEDYGIMLYGFTIYCLNNTVSGNTASNIITSNQDSGIYLLAGRDNTISNNTVNNNNQYGINLDTFCDSNTIVGNTIYYNEKYGVYLTNDCNNNNFTENFIYFNTNGAFDINSADCDQNRITRNVLVSEDERFIDDDGTNTIISMNYELLTPPCFYVEIIDQLFSTTEFTIIINIFSELCLDFSIQNIQMWWNGIVVPSSAITELRNGLYNISLTPIFVNPGEDPILLNMIISAAHHLDKYFETYIAVEQPEIVKFLQVDITEHFYSTEYFNFTFFIFNETEQGIDATTIQMWWNGTDVSTDIQNLGNGLYFVSVEPITVAPGEDPILLSMIITADGYEDKSFETHIAVDPDTLDKESKRLVEEFPLTIIIIAISSIAGGIGVATVSIVLLRKRRRVSEIK